MTTFRVALRSLNGGLSHQSHKTHLLRSLSTWENFGNGPINRQTDDSNESAKEFEHRLFGESSHSNSKTDAFFEKLGNFPNNQQTHDSFKSAKDFERRIFGESSHSNSKTDAFFEKLNQMHSRDRYTSRPGMLDDLDESFDTLTDGMDGKLKNAARYFEYDADEVEEDGYAFRHDASYTHDLTYDIKDLDLTKPAASKLPKFAGFTVTTEEVLRKADFRNVRFLANFITEAGIIIKRSQTGISAKAQRKVAREIKIARAFGLMPFTTMGTKSFVFGKTMESLDEDYLHESYETRMGTYMEGSETFVA